MHLRATESFRDGRSTCSRTYGAGALCTLAERSYFEPSFWIPVCRFCCSLPRTEADAWPCPAPAESFGALEAFLKCPQSSLQSSPSLPC